MSDAEIRTTDQVEEFRDSSALSNAGDDAGEIARLRDRLAYYESFDRLIQENIARSGELMREALDLRERTQAELARGREELERSRQELDRRLEAERQAQRDVLAGLVDELSTMQRSAERLSRRVSEAAENTGGDDVLVLGSGERGTAGARSMPDRGSGAFSAGGAVRSAAEARRIAETQDEPTDSESSTLSAGIATDQREGETDQESVIALPAAEATGSSAAELEPAAPADDAGSSLEDVLTRFASESSETGAGNGQPGPPVDETPPSQSPEDQEPGQATSNVEAISPTSGEATDEDADEPRAVTVLVHGVPRAATALSLQRHLAGLEHVSGVEAREYAEGVLRLQVTSSRALQFDDLAAWEDGRGIEPVHIHSDVIEVRLPGADF